MADVIPPVETQTQTAPVAQTQTGSEAVNTPEDPAIVGMRAEMLKERQARQALEASMSNPDFIYQQARALGMTEEQAAAEVAASTPQPPAPAQVQAPPVPTFSQVQALIAQQADYDRTVTANPEFLTDPDVKIIFDAQVAAGKKYSDAGRDTLAFLERTSSKGKSEAEKGAVENAKERASTASSSATPPSDSDGEVQVLQRATSLNRQTQDDAFMDLIKAGKL